MPLCYLLRCYIRFSYSHHDKYEFYLYSILSYNKNQDNDYIGGNTDYVDEKSQFLQPAPWHGALLIYL